MKLFFLILLTSTFACPLYLSAMRANESNNQNRYVLPSNIDIDIIKNSEGKITGSIKPLTGVPQDIKIRFLSSENIVVTSKPITLNSLDEVKTFPVDCIIKGTENNQWIKILVEYLPDFDSLLTRVKDVKAYPDQQLRSRLIEKVKGFKQETRKFKAATFYRFKEEN